MLTAPFLQMEQAFLQGSTDTAKASWSLGAPSREAVWFLQLFREGPKRRAHPQNGAWLSIPTKKAFNSVVGLLICCFRRSEKRPHKWNITTGTTPWVAPASDDGDVMSKLLWITSSIHKRSSRLVVFITSLLGCWIKLEHYRTSFKRRTTFLVGFQWEGPWFGDWHPKHQKPSNHQLHQLQSRWCWGDP